ncbi:unnamed protein product, partial [Adineta ricciae]
VRTHSKTTLDGLTTGDTLNSGRGVSSLEQSLREIDDVINTVRDQFVLDKEDSTLLRSDQFGSNTSLHIEENSPNHITQSPSMDYHQYHLSRMPPSYPSYTSASGFNQIDNNRDPRYMDSYGRSIPNPLPAIFRTGAVTSNIPMSSNSNRGQPFNYRPPPPPSYSTYDTPRNYNMNMMSSGYISDTNDVQRSSISLRPMAGSGSNSNIRRVGTTQPQPPQSYYTSSPATQYRTKIISSNDQSYHSDSECVGPGPRYTKISRQAIPNRRPSNVVLPIRSMTSKAYDEYVPPEPPRPQQPPFDLYRYQQEQQQRLEREQRERERQEQLQRQLYEQQQAAAAAQLRAQEQRRKSDTSIDHEIGAELLKSPIANKKRYADSSFFSTPFNTYPTIEEQKKMARKIASILEGGDPTQKGATKFEKQRQRAEKYTIEGEATTPTISTSNFRPLNPIQTNPSSFSNHQPPSYDPTNVPDCIKNSLDQAQYMNPLRYVGAPADFKQRHMQEHVTHTNVPPQAAMSIVNDLMNNRGKGAALFQKRKARSEKWVVDENNVKKSGYKPQTPSYLSETSKPWGQHAPASWSGDEGTYSGPSYTPTRPKFNPPPPETSSVSESILSPPPTQNVPRFGDFNAKPKGFGSWNAENIAPQTPRSASDSRKPANLNMEPSIREAGIAESHMRTASQPWSPTANSQSVLSPTQQQTDDFFTFPSSNVLSKWKNQEYSPWNQSYSQEQQQSQMPMTRDGVDQLRQRLTQQVPSTGNQSYQPHSSFNQRNEPSAAAYHPYSSSSQGSGQQYHFTDL